MRISRLHSRATSTPDTLEVLGKPEIRPNSTLQRRANLEKKLGSLVNVELPQSSPPRRTEEDDQGIPLATCALGPGTRARCRQSVNVGIETRRLRLCARSSGYPTALRTRTTKDSKWTNCKVVCPDWAAPFGCAPRQAASEKGSPEGCGSIESSGRFSKLPDVNQLSDSAPRAT